MSKLKLFKFGHEQCAPCRLMKPVLQKIAETYKETLEFTDVDTYQMTSDQLKEAQLKAVPTLTIVKDEKEVWRHVGIINEQALINKIQEYL